MMNMNRRSFFGLLGAAAAAPVPVLADAPPSVTSAVARYVSVMESAGYILTADDRGEGFSLKASGNHDYIARNNAADELCASGADFYDVGKFLKIRAELSCAAG